MQDRFVGDIGDFGKYGLLRALAGICPRAEPLLTLGVAWCIPDLKTIASTPSGHGQKIEYLFNPRLRDRYRSCDKQLFDRLKQLVCCERHIKAVEDSGLLGDITRDEVAFHDKPIPMPAVGQRRDERKAWFSGVREKIENARLVFLDPDTGLADPNRDRAPKRLSHGSKDAARYAFACELTELLEPGRTIAWYQSFRRNGDPQDQAQEWRERLARALPISDHQLHVMEYESRAFVILSSERDEEIIEERLNALVATASPWHGHFRPLK